MKFTWEESDIKGGLHVMADRVNEVWMIGYVSGADGEDRYCLVSLSDGAILNRQTKKQLAEELTGGSYAPLSPINH